MEATSCDYFGTRITNKIDQIIIIDEWNSVVVYHILVLRAAINLFALFATHKCVATPGLRNTDFEGFGTESI